MIYQILGICKDCKLSKHCLSSGRGLACNQYISIKAEKLKKRQADYDEVESSENIKVDVVTGEVIE